MGENGYPEVYVDYLAEYFGSRDYFECHEIMEEYWKENETPEFRTCWLVLIRVAVCSYHARRGNWKGAAKLMAKASGEADARQFDRLGLDGERLAKEIRRAAADWAAPGASYRDIELPIRDESLLAAAKRRSAEKGYDWGIGGLSAGADVIDRHLTRDRRDVVAARAEAARLKRISRSSP